MVLSIVMPVFNEGRTLEEILKQLGEAPMPIPWELIVIDDWSTDGATDEVQRSWISDAEQVRVVRARRNQGKGAALRKGCSL